MGVNQQHIIKTIRYDVELGDKEMASEVQSALSNMHKTTANLVLETALSSHTKEGVLHQFETVTLDLGTLYTASYAEKILPKIEEALHRFLAENNTVNTMIEVQTRDTDIQTLEHFLLHGHLPWNTNHSQDINSILSKIILTNLGGLRQLVGRLSQNENVHKRLASQFSRDTLQKMASQLNEKPTTTNEDANDVQEAISAVRNELEIYDAKKKMVTDLFMSIHNTEALDIERNNKKLDITMERQFLNAVYVNHAGLIIVAPYLGMLFSRLELTQNNEFVDAACQQRAVQLLGYVASGTDETPEHELLVPKILCGMPAEEPLVFEQPLMVAEMNIVDEMLGAITQQWAVINNTSTEGLRKSFIMRDGKLEDDEDAFYLKVEQKSFDMLLDQIPWNISKIKLSWMQKILEVTWR